MCKRAIHAADEIGDKGNMDDSGNPFRNQDGSAKRGYANSASAWDRAHSKPVITPRRPKENPFLDQFGMPRKGYEKSAAAWRQTCPSTTGQKGKFYQSSDWKRIRHDALKSSEGRCDLCGRPASRSVRLHVDHIIPRSVRPDLALDINNLQVLCADCNLGKGNSDSTDWRRRG